MPLVAAPLDLAYSEGWLKLLHYRASPLGMESEIDGQKFFISPDGKTDPKAELAATIDAIKSDAPVGAKNWRMSCAFPERTRFVRQSLNIETSFPPCADVENLLKEVVPESLTLIFASSFAEAPPSMFGHTFLRVNQRGSAGLLSYGLNFAATIPDGAGAEMAARGLLGGYEGHFTLAPFHRLVASYSHLENRDIWEYDLTFSKEETEHLIRHIWEIESNSYIDYYFLDENCSYQVLAALEAIRPDLNLTSKFGLYTLPIETLKVMTNVPGLVTQVKYRPSPEKILSTKIAALNEVDREAVENSLRSLTLSPHLSSAALDVVCDELLLRKRQNHGELDAKPAALLTEALDLLSKSSEPPASPKITPPERPDLAHKPHALGLGLGRSTRGKFTELMLKPALHDALNSATGYATHMHLDILRLSIRYFATGTTELEALEIVNMGALTPSSLHRPKMSWRFAMGLARSWYDEQVVHDTQGGTGIAFAVAPGLISYALVLAETELRRDSVRLKPWLTIGVSGSLSESVRILGEASVAASLDHPRVELWFAGSIAHALHRDLEARLSVRKISKHEPSIYARESDAELSLIHTF